MHKTLGEALYAVGYWRTVWVSFENIKVHEFGTFDPAAPLLDFPRRYGCQKRKGDLVGERFAGFIVDDVIRHPSNPLGIENNTAYVLKDGERYDCTMTTTGADIAAYDSFFRPAHRSLFGAPTTPTTPPPTTTPRSPTTTQRPTTTSAPTTTQAPGNVTPEPQRVEELRSLLRGALSGFTAPILKPGIDKFLASEFTTLALLRSVQAYRALMAKGKG